MKKILYKQFELLKFNIYINDLESMNIRIKIHKANQKL